MEYFRYTIFDRGRGGGNNGSKDSLGSDSAVATAMTPATTVAAMKEAATGAAMMVATTVAGTVHHCGR